MEEEYQALENRIKESLIGSKILDFKMERFKNRKTLYLLTLKTDAKRVEGIVKGTYLCPEIIRLRVKL